MTPNFSAFPWDHVPRLSRREAELQSIVARWIGATTHGATRVQALVGARVAPVAAPAGAPVDARVAAQVEVTIAVDDDGGFDPHAACARVRCAGGASIDVLGTSMGVRAIAQRLLGGPSELAAPRPLDVVEHSVWSLVVAAALEDLSIDGQVWPQLELVPTQAATVPAGLPAHASATRPARQATGAAAPIRLLLDVRAGELAMSVVLVVPAELTLRAPTAVAASRTTARSRWLERTQLPAPLVIGRCALHRDDLARLEVNDRITLEGVGDRRASPLVSASRLELAFAGGGVGLAAAHGAVEAEVVTGYVRRDMSLPDDAHVELTVGLGTTQLSLRQLADLAIGQIIPLGRPLAGPFEVRAAGRVLGRGELVDVDGELAVRIVSLGD
jgi:flagellar motor switch/type III secretory pathway protein FliN